MEADDVDCIAASLVREYLSRKGLRTTLTILDEEMPRTASSISNRQELVNRLHMDHLMKKNKEQLLPHRTILEVMTRSYMEKTSVKPSGRSEREKPDSVPPLTLQSAPASSQRESQGTRAHLARDHKVSLSDPLKANKFRHKEARNGYDNLVLEDALDDGETTLGQGNAGLIPKPLEMTGRKKPLRIRGISGPVSAVDTDRRRRSDANPERMTMVQDVTAPNNNGADPFPSTTHLYPSAAPEPVKLLGRHSSDGNLGKFSPASVVSGSMVGETDSMLPGSDEMMNILVADRPKRPSGSARPSRHVSDKDEPTEIADCTYDVQRSSISSEKLPIRPSSSKKSEPNLGMLSSNVAKLDAGAKSSVATSDKELGDVDDLRDTDRDLKSHVTGASAVMSMSMLRLDSKPIDVKTAAELKKLLFGSPSQRFNSEWQQQGFTFCDHPHLQYGLTQKKGGPCGIMATVQAHVLLHLVFLEPQSSKPHTCLSPNRQLRSEVLSKALAGFFWKAGQENKATVAIPSMHSYYSSTTQCRTDELTEMLMLTSFTNYDELLAFVKMNIGQFESDGSSGVVLALYSAILSRTIKGVKSDMDEPDNKLMGAHGYCTQEMVNLFLSGRARSNVFNDVMELESDTGPALVLKGIDCRQNIGFLSLFEHYQSCQVGTYMKTPKYPIWVICSESHFSVLFCLRRELMNDWKAERRFELYYYDGLARQDQEIKLSIDTTNRFFQPPSDNELVPPLDMCIRTKWTDAEVDWNSTEPLL